MSAFDHGALCIRARRKARCFALLAIFGRILRPRKFQPVSAPTRGRALAACCLVAAFMAHTWAQTLAPLRPPAVLLVTHDPYFSVWSMSDHLADDRTKRWTGAFHEKVGMARIDGKAYRFMGQSFSPLPPPMGTWSQKYNLVWNKLLSTGLFPSQVARRELAFYRTKQNRFGLPLDNRATYTKLDWIVWTATLSDAEDEFRAFISPVYRFINETPGCVPLTDWFDTCDAKQRGFQARSVGGGGYVKMLADDAM